MIKQTSPVVMNVWLAGAWLIVALLLTFAVTAILQGAFPIFTFVTLGFTLFALVRVRDPGKIGLRLVEWKRLAVYTGICVSTSLLFMLIFEPWSHTYRLLFTEAVSASRPDTTFGWLVRYSGAAGWLGFALYAGFVTLFAEEIFFRGLVLNWLNTKMNEVTAVIVQALLFSLPQLLAAFLLPPLQGFLYALVYSWLAIGLVNGWAASRTGSILPGLISATLYNILMSAYSIGF